MAKRTKKAAPAGAKASAKWGGARGSGAKRGAGKGGAAGAKADRSRALVGVRGADLVSPDGRKLVLKGVCLGGWLNSENFINGYPGVDHHWRRVMAEVLGESKAEFFFERMLDHFVTEEDVAYVASLGMNFVRIPVNCRRFESDLAPGKWREEGFRRLDSVISWARKHSVYVSIDLHAAQGWQNPDWHSDNSTGEALLWADRTYQERVFALWRELASRYAGEPAVACYDLLNEPANVRNDVLAAFYRELVAEVRKEDPRHVVFLEGNWYSTDFTGLDGVEDDAMGWHVHQYAPPSLTNGPYPNAEYDAARIEREYVARLEPVAATARPVWAGEFGSVYWGGPNDAARLKVVGDQISVFEHLGHSWTIWTYKDVGVMGLVHLPRESAYLEATRPVQEAKWRMRADDWGPGGDATAPAVDALEAGILEAMGAAAPEPGKLGREYRRAISRAASMELLPAYARCFAGMSENEIDAVLASFRLENCVRRDGLAAILSWHARA